jgi:hypothetical protein
VAAELAIAGGDEIMLKRTVAVLGLSMFVVAVAIAGGSPDAARQMTVGDFLKKVAVAAGEQPRDARAASETQKQRGLGENGEYDLSAPLTFGIVARIAGDLGVTVTPPSDSTRLVSAAQAGLIAGYIGANSAEATVSTLTVPPDQCLSSANRGACVDCCKAATGLTGKYCGQFCHANVPPPPSPGEPQP